MLFIFDMYNVLWEGETKYVVFYVCLFKAVVLGNFERKNGK